MYLPYRKLKSLLIKEETKHLEVDGTILSFQVIYGNLPNIEAAEKKSGKKPLVWLSLAEILCFNILNIQWNVN